MELGKEIRRFTVEPEQPVKFLVRLVVLWMVIAVIVTLLVKGLLETFT